MTDQATREAAAAVIDGAIDVLHERGWCQGQFTNPEGKVCLVSALMRAGKHIHGTVTTEHYDRARHALSVALGDLEPLEFNDDYGTTVEDVLLVLKESAHSLRDGAL